MSLHKKTKIFIKPFVPSVPFLCPQKPNGLRFPFAHTTAHFLKAFSKANIVFYAAFIIPF